MKAEGFEGHMGFVNGTTFPIFQRGFDGKVFLIKKTILLNVQMICNCDKYITTFITGCLGLCTDSFVFNQMKLAKEAAACAHTC